MSKPVTVDDLMGSLPPSELDPLDVFMQERLRDRARDQGGHRLSYADAFCMATVERHRAPMATAIRNFWPMGDSVPVIDLREDT